MLDRQRDARAAQPRIERRDPGGDIVRRIDDMQMKATVQAGVAHCRVEQRRCEALEIPAIAGGEYDERSA